MTKNVMIVGVGGQGSLLASKLLGYLLLNEGYDVKLRNAKVPLNLSYDNAGTCYVTDMFREDGQYYLHITANYRGLRQTYEEALFLIDMVIIFR